jgi:hypothetical protein
MMANQMVTASGTGHQNRISSDLELAICSELFMFHRNQKMLRAGCPSLQHRLHHNPLWSFMIC